jgi:hypothetical protein
MVMCHLLLCIGGEAMFLVTSKSPTSTHGHALSASALWLIMYTIRGSVEAYVLCGEWGKWNYGILYLEM